MLTQFTTSLTVKSSLDLWTARNKFRLLKQNGHKLPQRTRLVTKPILNPEKSEIPEKIAYNIVLISLQLPEKLVSNGNLILLEAFRVGRLGFQTSLPR